MIPARTRLLIVGGNTRLARALHAQASGQGGRPLVWCRSATEKAALLARFPAADLVSAADGSALENVVGDALCVVVCALGVVHPGRPDLATELAAFARETAALQDLLSRWQPAPHLVLVSSMLALLPPRDRAHYAGFKNLAEAACAAALRQADGTCLSVVYPGRLVETRRARSPAAWLATPYAALAQRLLLIAEARVPRSLVIGWDARIALLLSVPRLLAAALRNGLSVPVLARRDMPRAAAPVNSDPAPPQPSPQVSR